MRWDELFEDLEGHLAGIALGERDTEVAERIRIEDSRISWVQRLRAHLGKQVDLEVRSLGWIRGVLAHVGSDVAMVSGSTSMSLVPLGAVLSIAALGRTAETGAEPVASRLGLGSALRLLARDRVAVAIHRMDGSSLTGTPDRVGKDYLELAVHALDDGPRRAAPGARRVIPFAAVVLVRAGGPAAGP